MSKNFKNQSSEVLVQSVVNGMLERKAREITTIDLRNIPNAVSDFYVICHGTSNTQVEAIAESVGIEVNKTLNDRPIHVEGADVAEWILLDYVDVVVHVFQEESRRFYNLEDLWADADMTTIDESMTN
jgi:ribosome-associated protein